MYFVEEMYVWSFNEVCTCTYRVRRYYDNPVAGIIYISVAAAYLWPSVDILMETLRGFLVCETRYVPKPLKYEKKSQATRP